jgi:hypothetical protein
MYDTIICELSNLFTISYPLDLAAAAAGHRSGGGMPNFRRWLGVGGRRVSHWSCWGGTSQRVHARQPGRHPCVRVVAKAFSVVAPWVVVKEAWV